MNSNSVDYKAKEVNANESTKMPFTPQGWSGNSSEGSSCGMCGDKNCSC